MGWKHSLFGCHKDIKVCAITCCVPCFTFGKIYQALDKSCIICGLVFCIPCVNVYLLAKARENIRDKKSIEGKFPMDCALSCFCCGCVLCQTAREIDALDDFKIERK